MFLHSVDTQEVLNFNAAIAAIKAAGRPTTLIFGGKALADPNGSRLEPPIVEVTGRAAAKALQQHIIEQGTGDVNKIARLRRASLLADSYDSSSGATGNSRCAHRLPDMCM